MVLAGWELQSKRWFSLKLGPEEVPYLFKEGGGSQWASTAAELMATLLALHAFGWLDHGKHRKTLDVVLSAGTDNRANEALSLKRSTTRWPLMAVNMQLSSSLARARLSLSLKWRPRDENTEADRLTNEVFTGCDNRQRVVLTLGDMDLSVLESLVKTRQDFEIEREKVKQTALAQSMGGGVRPKRRQDKTPW